MLRAVLPVVAVLAFAWLPHPDQAATITTLKSLKLDVPTSDAMFPAGPGSDAINNNCIACHSADHVEPAFVVEGGLAGGGQQNDHGLQGSHQPRRRQSDRGLSGSHQGRFIAGSRKLAAIASLHCQIFKEKKSARYDENCNQCWNIGHGLLRVRQGADHQRHDARSGRCADDPASRERERAAAQCALGNRSG